MTLALISPHIYRQLSQWSLGTLFLEPHRECARHFFQGIAKQSPLRGPTWKQRSLHLLTSAALFFPIVSTLVYLALRFFVSRHPILSSQARPPTFLANPLTYAERVRLSAKIAWDEVDTVDVSFQEDLKKFIGLLEFDMLQLLRGQIEDKTALIIVENAEQELRCIAKQIRDLPQDLRSEIRVSIEAQNWQRRIYPFSTWSPTFITDFRQLIEEGQRQGFLNQRFGNFFGGTILHAMAKLDRYIPCVGLLKGTNIDPAVKDYWGNTALIWACANAANGIAKEILNVFGQGPYLNTQCSIHQNTALHLVVGKGYKDRSRDGVVLAYSNLDLLKILVSLKADVNLKNKNGNTPLHLAYLRRDMDMVGVLLAAGAKDSQLNGKGQRPSDLKATPYEEACRILYSTVSVFLLDRTEFERAHVS